MLCSEPGRTVMEVAENLGITKDNSQSTESRLGQNAEIIMNYSRNEFQYKLKIIEFLTDVPYPVHKPIKILF